jgi:ATP-dependent DNA helicase UvrD/PcrA
MSALTDRLLSLLPDLRLHHESDHDREVLIFGPPGTGKTRSLGVILDAHLKAGLPSDQMLVNAFTRNATQELRRRLSTDYGLTDAEMPWVRTIHSTCFQLLQLQSEQVVTMPRLKDFGESSGYKFQGILNQRSIDDPYSVGSIVTFGDWCYVAEELRRALVKTVPEIVRMMHRKNPTDVPWGEKEATDFSKMYREWKQSSGLFDFADMLEIVLRERLSPPVRWMFLDEVADMTPVQWRVAEVWKERCDYLMAFGDDDQSIFGFAGADPNELWSRPGHQFVLHHSYRLSSAVHAEAMSIIHRVSERVPKEFEPHYRGGEVDRLFGWADKPEGGKGLADRILETPDDSWALLVRNRVFADVARNVLVEAGIPFTDRTSTQGIPNPEQPRGLAIKIAAELNAGYLVRQGRLKQLMRQVYPDQWEVDRTTWGHLYGLNDLVKIGASPRLAQQLANDPLEAIRMEPFERRYLKRIAKRAGSLAILSEKPRVEVSTIHSFKGEEKDHVAVSASMTRRTYQEYNDDPDSENRVFYVAATRAKKTLTWIAEGHQGFRLDGRG